MPSEALPPEPLSLAQTKGRLSDTTGPFAGAEEGLQTLKPGAKLLATHLGPDEGMESAEMGNPGQDRDLRQDAAHLLV